MKLKQDLIFLCINDAFFIVDLTSFFKTEDWYFITCPTQCIYDELKLFHYKPHYALSSDAIEFAEKEHLFYKKVSNNDKHTHLHFWLQTTDRCNLNCSYCYIPSLHSSQRMDKDLLKRLEMKILEEKDIIRSVSLKISGGEPTLVFKEWKSQLEELRSHLSQHNITLFLQLNTNAVGLSKLKYKRELIDFINLRFNLEVQRF